MKNFQKNQNKYIRNTSQTSLNCRPLDIRNGDGPKTVARILTEKRGIIKLIILIYKHLMKELFSFSLRQNTCIESFVIPPAPPPLHLSLDYSPFEHPPFLPS